MLFERVEKKGTITFYFKQAQLMYASVYSLSCTSQNSTV